MSESTENLRVLGKKAAESAGLALSKFLNKQIQLHASFTDLLDIKDVHRNIFLKIENVGVMIFARLHQGLEGELIFILDERTAYRLVNLTRLKMETSDAGVITELGISAIKEIGNMVIGSYLTELSLNLKRTIAPPLSILISGSLEQIFQEVLYHPYLPVKNLQRYLIQTDFEVPQEGIKGNLSLALTPGSAASINFND
ncbi:MAG: chemotaxis protein CheC [Candidatus Omnitrophota bacterium]